jgi:hypothetical protein
MKNERNILDTAGLKSTPFNVPDGYFENLKTELKMIPKQQEKPAKVVRWKPFVRFASIAAVVAALITAGAFFLDKGGNDTGFTVIEGETDYFADLESLTEEDIIEYLISTGVELEDIEQY